MPCILTFILWFELTFIQECLMMSNCNREPQGAIGDKSPVDENFYLFINATSFMYTPEQSYNVTLSSSKGISFLSFTLAIEAVGLEDNRDINDHENDQHFKISDILGHFNIVDREETRVNQFCPFILESSTMNPKNSIDIKWSAPKQSEFIRCLIFKAAVLQERHIWYMDDGPLVQRLCPEESDNVSVQLYDIHTKCCACHEAKYEIMIERKWRRNTHAKDFPRKFWLTSIGEVIGATHAKAYQFWQYGRHASRGLQELAEHGSTKFLEHEIHKNLNMGNVRTIIKAPEIKYQMNGLGTTMATARADPEHCSLSFVAKIQPSPDWILGVANLNLCLHNCSWLAYKRLNLYPWDVGTDSGTSYLSSDQPKLPPEVIRRLTYQRNHDLMPFFDIHNPLMKPKPFAILHLRRLKIYHRKCNDSYDPNDSKCITQPWTHWSDCSVYCGTGIKYRERFYKHPQSAQINNCTKQLKEVKNCIGQQCGSNGIGSEEHNKNYGNNLDSTERQCELTGWSNWSDCSTPCGRGIQKRYRRLLNDYDQEKCQLNLLETRSCFGESCGGSINQQYKDLNETDDDVWVDHELPEQHFLVLPEILERNKIIQEHEQLNGESVKEINFHNRNDSDDILKKRRIAKIQSLPDYCLNKPKAALKSCNKKPITLKNYWFYDIEDRQCKLFTTDDCDENLNKFASIETCQSECSQNKSFQK